MLAACTYSRFPCFLLVSRVWAISSGFDPCFPLAAGLCKLYAKAGGKWQIQRQPLLVQYKQQANPPLSMHNYTPLVISGNDKNKQRNEKYGNTNGSVNSEGHLKIVKKKYRRDAYSGLDLSIYVIISPIQLVRQSLYNINNSLLRISQGFEIVHNCPSSLWKIPIRTSSSWDLYPQRLWPLSSQIFMLNCSHLPQVSSLAFWGCYI